MVTIVYKQMNIIAKPWEIFRKEVVRGSTKTLAFQFFKVAKEKNSNGYIQVL